LYWNVPKTQPSGRAPVLHRDVHLDERNGADGAGRIVVGRLDVTLPLLRILERRDLLDRHIDEQNLRDDRALEKAARFVRDARIWFHVIRPHAADRVSGELVEETDGVGLVES
jgi:hypothetical protein